MFEEQAGVIFCFSWEGRGERGDGFGFKSLSRSIQFTMLRSISTSPETSLLGRS